MRVKPEELRRQKQLRGSPGQDPSWAGGTPGPGRAHLPVLQVLHSHEQAARDVEELPAQAIWGQTQDEAVREAAHRREPARPLGLPPSTAALPGMGQEWQLVAWWLPEPARTSHPGRLPGNQDRVGGTRPALPSALLWVSAPDGC